jgi:hypothetical protein
VGLSVAERGAAVATFRYLEVSLMETAAAWTPTTPEMEVKLLLGRHIWDFAQHADALGRRTFELRLPLQHSLPPAAEYLALIDDVRRIEPTADRLAALYDVVLPGVERRYADFLAKTDPILDGPSVVIVERILSDLRRQVQEADALRRDLALPRSTVEPLRARESSVAALVVP